MNNNLELWSFIRGNMEMKIPIMLLYVVDSKGSSPGRKGFAMAVNRHGEISGSIGGGIMEFKFIEMAKTRLQEGRPYISIQRQVHKKDVAKNQSGMICSGEQTIFLYAIQPSDLAYVIDIIECLLHFRTGTLFLSPKGMSFSPENFQEEDDSYWEQSQSEWKCIERIGYKNHLYIIGGGHCSLALSRLMRTMDFYIDLYDDRSNLNTFYLNNYAHQKNILNDYAELATFIKEGRDVYVVVMTFGYRTDDIVIRALLDKEFRYFGVMGSAEKIKQMFNDYCREGIDAAKLSRIIAPIGLPISSKTPEEIAVSIAAQIIATKNTGA